MDFNGFCTPSGQTGRLPKVCLMAIVDWMSCEFADCRLCVKVQESARVVKSKHLVAAFFLFIFFYFFFFPVSLEQPTVSKCNQSMWCGFLLSALYINCEFIIADK